MDRAMFERFTDRARKVMALANQEAQKLNHDFIGVEHILLGLVIEGDGVGANVLNNLGADLKKVRKQVILLCKPGKRLAEQGKLPQTPRAKRVIENAIKEARALGHNYVGTEHLLLGVALEAEGAAAQALEKLGITRERICQEVLNLLGTPYALKEDSTPAITGKPIHTVPAELRSEPLMQKFAELMEMLADEHTACVKAGQLGRANGVGELLRKLLGALNDLTAILRDYPVKDGGGESTSDR